MTSATQSNSGASAYLAMLSSAVAGQRVLQSSDLDDPAVRQTVTSLLQGVERSAASSGWLADLYVQSAQSGTDYDAMWNYEAILKETNDKLRAMGKEPLYAVYPADGVAIADSPLGFVNHGRGADVEKFFTDLIDFLQSKPIAQRIADTGRRIPLHPEISSKPEPDWNFDPTRLVTAIRMPEPPVIRQALTLYQEALRKPSLTALCLDFSGSMQGAGEQQLQQAMTFLLTPKEASEVLVQWSPDDRIIVIPFDARVRDTFEATGKPDDQSRLLSEVADERAGGGTDMYACAQSALARFEEAPGSSKYLPAIVIMTDGRSQDAGANRFLNDWRHAPMRVPVFGITFGDADPHQLDALAQATGGRVFDGKGDLAGAFRAARGYN
jgi:Ca-activated chloride channel family protein